MAQAVGHKFRCQGVENVGFLELDPVQLGSEVAPGDAMQALVLVTQLYEALPQLPATPAGISNRMRI